MLSHPRMDDILEKGDNTFTSIIIAARRARNLNEGAEDLLEEYKGKKEVSKAFEEVVAGKVKPKL